uniref:MAM domain-containing protein n=1 Tax=Esox lucius TaxID=8010 RepID=A0AAY5KGB2_ESOLU
MVMYTHQFGPRSGGLYVLVAGTEIYPVWQRGGALGDLWVKAEVEIVSNTSFQVTIRDKEYGGVAIDSIMMSPNCRISEANFPDPPGHPCTSDTSKICDFHEDCVDKDDEARCGDFSYEKGSSGWTDSSVGRQQWMLNDTTQEKYLYVAKAPGQQFTEAQTRAPLLGPSGPQPPITLSSSMLQLLLCIHSSHPGALSVKTRVPHGGESLLWTRSGAHGNVWHEGLCPVPEQLTMSLNYTLERIREMQRNMASTCRVVGFLGYYMMVDSDVEILPEGSVAALTSPVHIGVARTECVYFWYHMGGENPGSLTVYMKPVKGDQVKIFSNSLEQGDTWRHGNGNISSTTTDWQVDKCDLESGLCGWTNTQNPELDQLDWELSSAEAKTHYTTPNHDHTLGNNRGHFLFLPSSTRDTANYKAWLLSPHLRHLPSILGVQTSNLNHWTYTTTTILTLSLKTCILEQLLTVKEVGAVWKRFDVDITSIDEYQIVFEGFKGETGVLALDDVDYDIGFNCAGEARDPLTSNGGIAASVIVLLLLLASLGALLYFYLRLQEEKKAMPKSVDHPASAQAGFINDVYDSTPLG